MKIQEAKELGVRIVTLAKAGQMTQACALLAPVLAERTPFPLLGQIGEYIGDYLLEMVNAFLEHVGPGKAEGGWVVIGSGLKTQLGRDLSGALNSLPRLYHRWLVSLISQLLAGPLADKLLEPAMAKDGSPAPVFGWLVGTGTGAGIGLQFVVTDLMAAMVGLGSYLFRVVRDIEDILPDHDKVGIGFLRNANE